MFKRHNCYTEQYNPIDSLFLFNLFYTVRRITD